MQHKTLRRFEASTRLIRLGANKTAIEAVNF
jgi:hypothetical protein